MKSSEILLGEDCNINFMTKFIFRINFTVKYYNLNKSIYGSSSIYDDTLNLRREIEVEREIKTKVFTNELPAFSLSYPENFIELKPNPTYKQVFVAITTGCDLTITIYRISPKRRLEEAVKKIVTRLKWVVKEIRVISNKSITLRDGTPAYESIIEFKSVGNNKVKSIHISVFKDEKWIRVSFCFCVTFFAELTFNFVLRSTKNTDYFLLLIFLSQRIYRWFLF